MKTIFTQKSVVLEYVPTEKGSLVVYAGTAKKFTEKKPEECAELLFCFPPMVLLEFQLPSPS